MCIYFSASLSVFLALTLFQFHLFHDVQITIALDRMRSSSMRKNEFGSVDLSKYAWHGKVEPLYRKCYRRVDVHFINNCEKLLWQLKSSTSEQIEKHFFAHSSSYRAVDGGEGCGSIVKNIGSEFVLVYKTLAWKEWFDWWKWNSLCWARARARSFELHCENEMPEKTFRKSNLYKIEVSVAWCQTNERWRHSLDAFCNK